MGELKLYVEGEANKKKKTPEEWLIGLQKAIKEMSNSDKCTLATHVGKFADPDTKVNIYDKVKLKSCGYVMTATTEADPDIYTPANYMAVAKFLLYKTSDDETVLNHIMEGSEFIRKELDEINLPFEDLQEVILHMIPEAYPEFTDGNLRQVYFPVKSDYHLLTILPASSLLETLTSKIIKMNQTARNCKWYKDSEDYGKPYRDLPDRTLIGYGGTKPQNISTMNLMHAGKADVLMSMPPQLKVRNIRKPVRSFLDETISYRDYSPILHRLDKLAHEERNNIHIRNRILKETHEIIDIILTAVMSLRNEEPGWSKIDHYKNLPLFQKIWLDEEYKDSRKSEPEWIENASDYFGRWVLRQYKRLLKDNSLPMGDAELAYFKREMQQVLEDEVRYGL